MTVKTIDKARKRPHPAVLMVLAAASFVVMDTPARANSFANGNFALTSDSTLANGQAVSVFGGTGTGYGYNITDWSQCLPTTTPACPSGNSSTAGTPTGNGNTALAFVYTYGSQANTITDHYGTNNFQMADTSAIPNTYPGACSPAPTALCGNYLAMDGGASNDMAIYQTITGLTSGANYAVSFYMAAGQQSTASSATTEYFDVYFGTTSTYTETSTTTISNPQGSFTPWSLVTMNFTANSATQILEFVAQGGPVSDPPMDFLADINFSQTPEPSSLALIGAGTLGLLAVRRRRKKA
jgi:hypothetical protein